MITDQAKKEERGNRQGKKEERGGRQGKKEERGNRQIDTTLFVDLFITPFLAH